MAPARSEEERKVVHFNRGAFLCRQGEKSRDLYIIRTGQVRVYKTEGGVEVDLDIAGPGAVVGEISAIDGECRSASMMATQETDALLISGGEFSRVVSRLPDWFQKIAKILVQRLRDVDSKIDFSKGGDKSAHAAALISLMVVSGYGEEVEGGVSLAQSLVEDEMVDLLNVPASESGDVVLKLQKMGLIVVDKGKVVVMDRAKLDVFANRIFATGDIAPAI